MALTAYCKKCNREVTPGEICPVCGTRLGKNAAHAAWVVECRPVTDWMRWNGVMRYILPAGLVLILLAIVLEAAGGGTAAVETLMRGSFPRVVLWLLLGVILAVFLILLLQGKELEDCVVDSRGVHVTRYLPEPTALKLILRLQSPARLNEMDPDARVLRLEETSLRWTNVARVQLWPEKCYILFYAPKWWMRVAVRCTPFSWNDALVFVKDKLGKKKAVDLPEHLRVQAARKTTARKKPVAPERVTEEAPVRAEASAQSVPEPVYEDDPWEMEKPEEPEVSEIPEDAGEQMAMPLDEMEEP